MTGYTLQMTRATVEETDLALIVNGVELNRFNCTPEALEELCIGHLYSRGIISSREQISPITVEQEGEGYTARCDTVSGADIPGGSDPRLPELEELPELMGELFRKAGKYRRHGGIHCSALYDGRRFVAHFEDVGRHNAFDKVVGRALLDGRDPGSLIYFTSGRVNAEIAAKAAICRFPLIVSRSIATTQAAEIAAEANVGIIGRAASDAPILFSTPRSHG